MIDCNDLFKCRVNESSHLILSPTVGVHVPQVLDHVLSLHYIREATNYLLTVDIFAFVEDIMDNVISL